VNEAQRERALKFRVGIFVLVSVLAFLGTIYALGARARLFESRYTIYAEFTQVAGLAPGATVRLAGVQIGRVKDITLSSEPGGRVRVAMSVATQYANRIRKDSQARIVTQGLLGDKIVEITVGTADTPPVQAGEALVARDPFEIGDVISQSAETIKGITGLAESLRKTAETLNQSGLIEDASATVKSAHALSERLGKEASATLKSAQGVTERVGRLVDRVEKGPGLAHTLIYEEPVALRKVNDLIASTQGLLDRVERGEGALGVLTSKESTDAAKRLVALMDRIGRTGDRHPGEDGLLVALLFDPKYRAILDEVRGVAHNLRIVSERVLGGRGTLGSLVKDEPDDGGLRLAIQDLQAAMANVKQITGKINEGEGTLGALIADPTVYEQLVSILEGAQRSSILRFLIRGLGKDRGDKAAGKDKQE
jgi:phospholipid/cholesterol/gamma-HCH transport system substrate-binding protein